MNPVSETEMLSFGRLPELFVEYVRRSGPYTMGADHFHDYYEIYYMLSGKRIYFVKDRSYTVEQGDLVFIPRNELHKTLYAGEASHERVIIHFDDRFPQAVSSLHASFLLSPFHQAGPVLRLPRQEQLMVDQLIRRTLTEIECRRAGYEMVPAHTITELLLIAARYGQENDLSPLHHDTPLHSKISEIVRYINLHYAEPMKLASLSEFFYISPYYLSRMFKEVTGFSFTDYLILTRIKEAQRLLRESELKITDIAAAVGFDNFSHFGKTFKKITRVSPRDYRKKEYGIVK
ncbi:helix-turn-helix domain-containing protein [Paenibacillus abyssi]|uniref:AraC family transcriptional regulator n=1 Tax=Paenibacillus abyssi TaxID=1340531 RepID=A0A917CUA9_9BACL|nr:AraC family transcriptional regulator [Paenibacillus abyssi]GGF99879.1 AraC family transcriptional regulator [Paenibacillus abyssi]